jgi:hypothetical protein
LEGDAVLPTERIEVVRISVKTQTIVVLFLWHDADVRDVVEDKSWVLDFILILTRLANARRTVVLIKTLNAVWNCVRCSVTSRF